jgi:hypothetical protein
MSELERARAALEVMARENRSGADLYVMVARDVLALSERVDALTFGVSKEHEAGVRERHRTEAAEERVKVLEAALEFYADEERYRWSEGLPLRRGVIQAEDKGAKARAALRDSQTE